MPKIEPVFAGLVYEELCNNGITHLVGVPDSCQDALYKVLDADSRSRIRYIAASSEDQAISINAGLYIGGKKSVVTMQNSGLYRCLNSIRGIALEMSIPTVILFGLYRRDIKQELHEHKSLAIRNFLPTLSIWRIKNFLLNNNNAVPAISHRIKMAESNKDVSAIIFGTNLA